MGHWPIAALACRIEALGMHSALIFSERTGGWCVALRRLLDDSTPQIVETRSLVECREALASRPASLLVLEATAETLPTLLSWLARLERDFPQAQAAVVADRGLAEHEWPLREAGAFAFVTSRRQLEPLADAVRLFTAAQAAPEMTLSERIWKSLPWQRP